MLNVAINHIYMITYTDHGVALSQEQRETSIALLVTVSHVDRNFIITSGRLRNVEYSILSVMSELSTVRCDRVLGQVHGRRVSTVSCRGGAQAGRQLWHLLLDRGRKRR